MSGSTPVAVAVTVLALLAAPGAGARAQDLKRPEEQLAAIYALRVQLEVEQRELDEGLQRYSRLAQERDDARARVARMQAEVDGIVSGRLEGEPGALEAREDELRAAEQGLQALTDAGREIRRAIRRSHERIELLQERIARLRKTLPADTESLTGSWDISYLPSGDKGVFTLRQSGTILVGEYSLEGGWKGSLQGTFVDGKVLLHRIDSKLGRSSDLEGTISPDGRTIRGTWQNFILSGGAPVNGQWVARKRQERPEGSAP